MIPKKERKMARKGKGRFFNRPTMSKGKKYDKFFIYVPAEVARDTNFPFNDKDRVTVKIQGDALIVRKAEENST